MSYPESNISVTLMKTSICHQCGSPYTAHRSTSRYCSDVCRVYHWRGSSGKPMARKVTADKPKAISPPKKKTSVLDDAKASKDWGSKPSAVKQPSARVEEVRVEVQKPRKVETERKGFSQHWSPVWD